MHSTQIMRTFPGFLLGTLLCGSMLCAPVFAHSTTREADELSFVTEEFHPFSYARADPATGDPVAAGPLVEVVQLVCGRLERRCSVDIYPWRRALALAEDGDVDGIFTVIRSPERERAFRITRMLVRSHYALFARTDSDHIYRGPQDLAGRTIGVYGPSGSSFVLSKHLKQAPGARMHLVTDNLQSLLMLKSGRFGPDGLAMLNHHVARNLIATEGLNGIREVGQLEPIAYGIGFSRKAVGPEEFQAFERALTEAVKDGSVREILLRHGVDPVD